MACPAPPCPIDPLDAHVAQVMAVVMVIMAFKGHPDMFEPSSGLASWMRAFAARMHSLGLEEQAPPGIEAADVGALLAHFERASSDD